MASDGSSAAVVVVADENLEVKDAQDNSLSTSSVTPCEDPPGPISNITQSGSSPMPPAFAPAASTIPIDASLSAGSVPAALVKSDQVAFADHTTNRYRNVDFVRSSCLFTFKYGNNALYIEACS